MNDKNYYSPEEIAAITVKAGTAKAGAGTAKLLGLALMAGMFIAFASEGSNMAAYNLLSRPETYGLGKALAGTVFGTGLMLVVIAGGELFTGNTMMIMALLEKKISAGSMFRNWLLVYWGNLLGALAIAGLMTVSGLFNSSAGLLGGMTIKIAAYKTGLGFTAALSLGILCNLLVCGAVWMAYGAKDVTGKIWACFFPIWLFITSGFEHSIANMYYIPAGILAKANPVWAEASGVAAEVLAQLNWTNFFIRNLLPVTLGNVIGGGLMIGGIYWFCFLRQK
ncbi:MAG TPA: FdhC protein [Peptococcaceae bacterium]|nr:FdhC protein [Peptococcaceae bacterium]